MFDLEAEKPGHWTIEHEFHETCHSVTFIVGTGQFTPNVKANKELRLLSTLV